MHVSLSMRTVNGNGKFNLVNGKNFTKFAKINSLQNYLLYSKLRGLFSMKSKIKRIFEIYSQCNILCCTVTGGIL